VATAARFDVDLIVIGERYPPRRSLHLPAAPARSPNGRASFGPAWSSAWSARASPGTRMRRRRFPTTIGPRCGGSFVAPASRNTTSKIYLAQAH
jgi:hypothetical protein